MYGSIFYNCWSALFGFTVYFVLALQNQFAAPIAILLGAFVAAIIAFALMYPIRYLLNFILFTPETVPLDIESTMQQSNIEAIDENTLINESNETQVDDESTEDIAKVVRSMMYEENETKTAS